MNNIFVTSKLISRKEFSELDIQFKEDFGFNYKDDEEFILIEKIEKGIRNYPLESEPIDIDKLINYLNSIKEKGANYAGIDFHCDHQSYIIGGYSIRFSDDKEISEYQEIEQKEKEKQEKILKLHEEIHKLKSGDI